MTVPTSNNADGRWIYDADRYISIPHDFPAGAVNSMIDDLTELAQHIPEQPLTYRR